MLQRLAHLELDPQRSLALWGEGRWDVELYVTSPSLCAVPVLLGRQSGRLGTCGWATERQLHAEVHN